MAAHREMALAGVAPPDFPGIDLQNPQMWLLIHQIDRVSLMLLVLCGGQRESRKPRTVACDRPPARAQRPRCSGRNARPHLRHILLECGLLALAGALGGIALGYTSVRVLAAIVELPPHLDFTPDRRLFAAAFAAAFVAMLVFGLAPA